MLKLLFWLISGLALVWVARQLRPGPRPLLPPGNSGLMGLDGHYFPLLSLVARAEVTGCFSTVTVTQCFANPRPEPVEAIYIFPLPGRASVFEFRLTTGERSLLGRVAERGQARQVYREAVEAGQQAALLEQQRDNVFTLAVGNLLPGEEVTVELSYVERLEMAGGEVEFRFPVLVAERYAAEPAISPPRVVGQPFDFGLSLQLNTGGRALKRLWSGQHPVASRDTSQGLELEVTEGLHQEFVLRYSLCQAPEEAWLYTHADYFLLTVFPPAMPVLPAPRDVVFLLDRSGSMQGRNEQVAREAMRTLLGSLGAQDRFAVLAFDDRVEPFNPGWTPASERAQALAFVEGIGARGGTKIGAALNLALQLDCDPARGTCVLLITDGQVGNEAAIYADVQRSGAGWRIYTLGIDRNVNEAFLRRLAALGGGTCELVLPGQDLSAPLGRLSQELGAPAATGLRLAGPVRELLPEPLPALFSERPLVALGQLSGPGALSVRGDEGFAVDVAPLAVEHDLARLWAREKISALEDRLRLTRDPALKQELLELSLRYNLLSSVASFVVVDEQTRTTLPCQKLRQPSQQERCMSSARKPESVVCLMQVDRWCLEVGRELVPLCDPNQGAPLVARVGELRQALCTQWGFPFPGLRIRDNRTLGPGEYAISLRGTEVARGQVSPNQLLALGAPPALAGVRVQAGVWIGLWQRAEAEALGCQVLDVLSVILNHLAEVLRAHVADFLGREEVAALGWHCPQGLGTLHGVLQELVRQGGALPPREVVLQELARGDAPVPELVERVRVALGS